MTDSDGARAPALALRGIGKTYGRVVACDAVDLTVRRGEIHGLLGENGAGKSTLMKILLGLVRRDTGTIHHDGSPVEVAGPQEAIALGIGMVHQHFSLIEPLTVWENVTLGDTGRVDRTRACTQVEEVGARYGLPIDPLAPVSRLSAGERQRVELIKCLRRDPSVLVLDEPTSVLTQAESAELFGVLREVVAGEDRAVILISHKLAEITAATDRVTVLRKGRVAFHSTTADTTAQELARQMVGRDVSLRAEGAALGMLPVDRRRGAAEQTAEPEAAPACGCPASPSGPRASRCSTTSAWTSRPARSSGCTGWRATARPHWATCSPAWSNRPPDRSRSTAPSPIRASRGAAPGRARHHPRDRHASGVVLDMSVADNLVMKSLGGVSGRVFLDRRRKYETARQLAAEFNIITSSLDAPVRSLSGGNQQRVVLAREMSADPAVLVAAQPTHGLDVGAIEDMYLRLRRPRPAAWRSC